MNRRTFERRHNLGGGGGIRTHSPSVKSREQSPVVLRLHWCSIADLNCALAVNRASFIISCSFRRADAHRAVTHRAIPDAAMRTDRGTRFVVVTPTALLTMLSHRDLLDVVPRRGIEPRSLGCRPSVISRSTIRAKLCREKSACAIPSPAATVARCLPGDQPRLPQRYGSRCCHRTKLIELRACSSPSSFCVGASYLF